MNREEAELAAKLNRMTPKELARYLTSIIGQQTDRIEALTAENDRLRGILTRFVDHARVGCRDKPVTQSKRVNCPSSIYHEARAALAGKAGQ